MKKKIEDLRSVVEEGAWNSLVSCAKFYAQNCMHPHETIIITQTGIELLEGQKAKPFELKD